MRTAPSPTTTTSSGTISVDGGPTPSAAWCSTPPGSPNPTNCARALRVLHPTAQSRAVGPGGGARQYPDEVSDTHERICQRSLEGFTRSWARNCVAAPPRPWSTSHPTPNRPLPAASRRCGLSSRRSPPMSTGRCSTSVRRPRPARGLAHPAGRPGGIVTGAARGIGRDDRRGVRPRRRPGGGHRHCRLRADARGDRRAGRRHGIGVGRHRARRGRPDHRAPAGAPRRPGGHPGEQRRHHPRQAAGEYGRCPLGCGDRRESGCATYPAHRGTGGQRQHRGRRPGDRPVVDGRDRRQPRADQLCDHKGRNDRDHPGARTVPGEQGITINAVAPGSSRPR